MRAASQLTQGFVEVWVAVVAVAVAAAAAAVSAAVADADADAADGLAAAAEEAPPAPGDMARLLGFCCCCCCCCRGCPSVSQREEEEETGGEVVVGGQGVSPLERAPRLESPLSDAREALGRKRATLGLAVAGRGLAGGLSLLRAERREEVERRSCVFFRFARARAEGITFRGVRAQSAILSRVRVRWATCFEGCERERGSDGVG
jgi:hypothetical protein